MEELINKIKKEKIIAIIRSIYYDDIMSAAKALKEGGIKLIEVTFNQSSITGEEDTVRAIRELCDYFGDSISIGAGTVLNVKQTEMAVNAGARFIISPDTNPDVIKRTNELKAISIPGAFTPTEIAFAYKTGAHFVKLFPAESMGIEYIRAVRAPLSHIPLLAVGGVNEDNLREFFKAGICGVGIGSNIVNKSLIKEKKFDELTILAKKYTSQI